MPTDNTPADLTDASSRGPGHAAPPAAIATDARNPPGGGAPFWPPALVWLVFLVVERNHPVQGRLDFILRLVAVVSLLVFAVRFCRRLGAARLALAAPFVCWIAFEWIVGAYRFWCDLTVALACTSLWLYASPSLRTMVHSGLPRNTLAPRKAAGLSASLLLALWIMTYAADAVVGRIDRSRTKTRVWSGYPDGWPAARVGVALSGGGYRAALFHAGVLQGLEQMRVRPRALSTVSGGSIVGAFYARGGDMAEFGQLLADGGFNLKRELLAPWNVARYLFTARVPGTREGWLVDRDFTRTDVQARLLDNRLLGEVSLSAPPAQGAPELVLCTTDLVSGDMVGFFRGGFLVRPRLPVAFRERWMNGGGPHEEAGGRLFPGSFENRIADRPLSFFVSASGAFPGAFEAPAVLDRTGDGFVSVRYLLADGGIADNLGIAMLNEMAIEGWRSRRPRKTTPEEAAADSFLTGLAAAMDSITGRRGPGSFSGGLAETDSASAELDRIMPAWALHLAIASDASAIPVESTPRSVLGELGNAVDAIYRSTGGTSGVLRPGQVSIPAVLISPATLLPAMVPAYQVETLSRGDPSMRVLSFPYEARDSLYDRRPRHAVVRRTVPPNFQQLTRADLNRLVDLLPRDERAAALAKLPLVDTLVHLEALDDSMRSLLKSGAEPVGGGGPVEALRARIREHQRLMELRTSVTPALLRAHAADSELYRIVYGRLARDVAIFIRASTLDDRFDEETVDALMRLGHMLVILNRTWIANAMEGASRLDDGQSGDRRPSAAGTSDPER